MDAALIQFGDKPVFDLDLADGDLATDSGLKTAVIVSLFTDRRAEPADALPDGSGDRRGWWADAWPARERDRIGSRLWLLSREKELPEVRRRAEDYAREALQWLIDDRIAQAVRVEATTRDGDILHLRIVIARAGGGEVDMQFNTLWRDL